MRTILNRMPNVGKVIIFAAPSGSGKTTLVKYLLERISGLDFSVSATTRDKRPHERDGVDYHFLTPLAFKERVKNHEFVEWEEVYTDLCYGTLISEIEQSWDEGNAILFDVDVKGALSLKEEFADGAITVFVRPPSLASLEQRLRNRGTETEASLEKRLSKASQEMEYEKHFDTVIVNDDLATAKAESEKVVRDFLSKWN